MIKILLGCYEDREDARLLPERPKTFIAADQLTNAACNTACVSEGFSYAGVGNSRPTCTCVADRGHMLTVNLAGNECWCGTMEVWNTFSTQAKRVDETMCNIPCTGESNEYCGGAWYIHVTDYTREVALATITQGDKQYRPVATYSISAHQAPLPYEDKVVSFTEVPASVATVVEPVPNT